MAALKTVDMPTESTDLLKSKQHEDVARMRTSLLACSEDPSNIPAALKNITILRVMHQVSRIIRYIDMMDKIEDKLYETLDIYLEEEADIYDSSTLNVLLNIQERMQRTMLESHKLLQPYLSIDEFGIMDTTISTVTVEDDRLLPKESRDLLRNNAQQLLTLLDTNHE